MTDSDVPSLESVPNREQSQNNPSLMAYDVFREARPDRASREYLQILELAARENEALVDDALRSLLDGEQPITAQAVVDWMGRREPARPATEVQVDATELSSFDQLFSGLLTDLVWRR